MNAIRLSLVGLLALGAVIAQAEELVTLATRPSVEQSFLLIKPEHPIASVILFTGGKGTLHVSSFLGSVSVEPRSDGFLVSTRELFAEHGFIVALVAAPSDRQSRKGMYGGFRNSVDHVTDIDVVIRYLREIAAVPVWLIGTSRGTESATYIAIHSQEHPDGLVLTSAVTVPNWNGAPVTSLDLESIKIPALVISHAEDVCPKTPPAGADTIAARLTHSTKVAVKHFSGGNSEHVEPCSIHSHHGYGGIEREVVDYIAEFIMSNSSKGSPDPASSASGRDRSRASPAGLAP